MRERKTERKRTRYFVIAVGVVYVAVLLIYFIRSTASSSSLYVTSNVKSTVIHGSSRSSTPCNFRIARGVNVIAAYRDGFVESVVALNLPGAGGSYSFNLPKTPGITDIPGGESCIYPSFSSALGSLMFLSGRGSSISRLQGSQATAFSQGQLTQISNISWSPGGDLAIIRVEPDEGSPPLQGSPVACDTPSSFLFSPSSNRFFHVAIEYAQGATIASDGKTVAFGSADANASFVNLATLALPAGGGGEASINSVHSFRIKSHVAVPWCKISPDGRLIAFIPTPTSDMSKSNLYILDTRTGKVSTVCGEGNVYDAAWSPGSRFLVYEYRAPDTGFPTLFCFDSLEHGNTSFSAHTYLAKLTFFSETAAIYGLPYKLDEALKRTDHQAPDYLVYGSLLTFNQGIIITPGLKQHFTSPVLSPDRNTLYYVDAMFLRSIDLSEAKNTITLFEKSEESPVKAAGKR